MKRLNFYATQADLVGALGDIDDVRFTEIGNFETAKLLQYDDVAAIPALGQSRYGSASANPSYLVMLRDMKVDVRLLAGRDQMRHLVDQLDNPDSIVFQPGGLFTEDALIAGHIGTATDNQVSVALMKKFSRQMTRGFTKVRAFLVGPEALAMFHDGKRLTDSVGSPRDYDLAAL